MSTITDSTISTLNDLIATLRDGEKGFKDAAEHVKREDLKSLFFDFSKQRSGLAAELQTLVTAHGGEPETDSTITSALHRGWLDLRAALTSGSDHSILSECERGEDVAVSAYKKAGEEAVSPEVASVIATQFATVKATHDRVKALRDAAK